MQVGTVSSVGFAVAIGALVGLTVAAGTAVGEDSMISSFCDAALEILADELVHPVENSVHIMVTANTNIE